MCSKGMCRECNNKGSSDSQKNKQGQSSGSQNTTRTANESNSQYGQSDSEKNKQEETEEAANKRTCS